KAVRPSCAESTKVPSQSKSSVLIVRDWFFITGSGSNKPVWLVGNCYGQFAQRCRLRRIAGCRCLAVDPGIKDVSLLWNKAGFADQVTQHLFVGTIVGARSRHDVFFNHDSSNVVGTETQGHLTKF